MSLEKQIEPEFKAAKEYSFSVTLGVLSSELMALIGRTCLISVDLAALRLASIIVEGGPPVRGEDVPIAIHCGDIKMTGRAKVGVCHVASTPVPIDHFSTACFAELSRQLRQSR